MSPRPRYILRAPARPAAGHSGDPAVLQEPFHDETARRARELWIRDGRPVGRDLAIWLEAEQQTVSAHHDPGGRRLHQAPWEMHPDTGRASTPTTATQPSATHESPP